METQKRGGQFWLWADCLLQATGHKAQLQQGNTIDVQARTSREGHTQLFIGVYGAGGLALCEEYYPKLPDDTVEQAINWGIRRCEVLIERATPFTAPYRINAQLKAPLIATAGDPSLRSSKETDDDERRREAFLAASKKARTEYAEAKAALFSVMRDSNADDCTITRHVRRWHDAVDLWVSLPRQYISDTGNALSQRTPDRAPPDSHLFAEEPEHYGLGVGFARI